MENFPFEVGEVILAEWEDKLYYAKILRIGQEKRICILQFDDDSEERCPFDKIHSVTETTAEIVCIKCKDGVSAAPNEIVLCDKCGIGYHQQCHDPTIPAHALEPDVPWMCVYCKLGDICPYVTENPFDSTKEGLRHREIHHIHSRENNSSEPNLNKDGDKSISLHRNTTPGECGMSAYYFHSPNHREGSRPRGRPPLAHRARRGRMGSRSPARSPVRSPNRDFSRDEPDLRRPSGDGFKNPFQRFEDVPRFRYETLSPSKLPEEPEFPRVSEVRDGAGRRYSYEEGSRSPKSNMRKDLNIDRTPREKQRLTQDLARQQRLLSEDIARAQILQREHMTNRLELLEKRSSGDEMSPGSDLSKTENDRVDARFSSNGGKDFLPTPENPKGDFINNFPPLPNNEKAPRDDRKEFPPRFPERESLFERLMHNQRLRENKSIEFVNETKIEMRAQHPETSRSDVIQYYGSPRRNVLSVMKSQDEPSESDENPHAENESVENNLDKSEHFSNEEAASVAENEISGIDAKTELNSHEMNGSLEENGTSVHLETMEDSINDSRYGLMNESEYLHDVDCMSCDQTSQQEIHNDHAHDDSSFSLNGVCNEGAICNGDENDYAPTKLMHLMNEPEMQCEHSSSTLIHDNIQIAFSPGQIVDNVAGDCGSNSDTVTNEQGDETIHDNTTQPPDPEVNESDLSESQTEVKMPEVKEGKGKVKKTPEFESDSESVRSTETPCKEKTSSGRGRKGKKKKGVKGAKGKKGKGRGKTKPKYRSIVSDSEDDDFDEDYFDQSWGSADNYLTLPTRERVTRNAVKAVERKGIESEEADENLDNDEQFEDYRESDNIVEKFEEENAHENEKPEESKAKKKPGKKGKRGRKKAEVVTEKVFEPEETKAEISPANTNGPSSEQEDAGSVDGTIGDEDSEKKDKKRRSATRQKRKSSDKEGREQTPPHIVSQNRVARDLPRHNWLVERLLQQHKIPEDALGKDKEEDENEDNDNKNAVQCDNKTNEDPAGKNPKTETEKSHSDAEIDMELHEEDPPIEKENASEETKEQNASLKQEDSTNEFQNELHKSFLKNYSCAPKVLPKLKPMSESGDNKSDMSALRLKHKLPNRESLPLEPLPKLRKIEEPMETKKETDGPIEDPSERNTSSPHIDVVNELTTHEPEQSSMRSPVIEVLNSDEEEERQVSRSSPREKHTEREQGVSEQTRHDHGQNSGSSPALSFGIRPPLVPLPVKRPPPNMVSPQKMNESIRGKISPLMIPPTRPILVPVVPGHESGPNGVPRPPSLSHSASMLRSHSPRTFTPQLITHHSALSSGGMFHSPVPPMNRFPPHNKPCLHHIHGGIRPGVPCKPDVNCPFHGNQARMIPTSGPENVFGKHPEHDRDSSSIPKDRSESPKFKETGFMSETRPSSPPKPKLVRPIAQLPNKHPPLLLSHLQQNMRPIMLPEHAHASERLAVEMRMRREAEIASMKMGGGHHHPEMPRRDGLHGLSALNDERHRYQLSLEELRRKRDHDAPQAENPFNKLEDARLGQRPDIPTSMQSSVSPKDRSPQNMMKRDNRLNDVRHLHMRDRPRSPGDRRDPGMQFRTPSREEIMHTLHGKPHPPQLHSAEETMKRVEIERAKLEHFARQGLRPEHSRDVLMMHKPLEAMRPEERAIYLSRDRLDHGNNAQGRTEALKEADEKIRRIIANEQAEMRRPGEPPSITNFREGHKIPNDLSNHDPRQNETLWREHLRNISGNSERERMNQMIPVPNSRDNIRVPRPFDRDNRDNQSSIDDHGNVGVRNIKIPPPPEIHPPSPRGFRKPDRDPALIAREIASRIDPRVDPRAVASKGIEEKRPEVSIASHMSHRDLLGSIAVSAASRNVPPSSSPELMAHNEALRSQMMRHYMRGLGHPGDHGNDVHLMMMNRHKPGGMPSSPPGRPRPMVEGEKQLSPLERASMSRLLAAQGKEMVIHQDEKMGQVSSVYRQEIDRIEREREKERHMKVLRYMENEKQYPGMMPPGLKEKFGPFMSREEAIDRERERERQMMITRERLIVERERLRFVEEQIASKRKMGDEDRRVGPPMPGRNPLSPQFGRLPADPNDFEAIKRMKLMSGLNVPGAGEHPRLQPLQQVPHTGSPKSSSIDPSMRDAQERERSPVRGKSITGGTLPAHEQSRSVGSIVAKEREKEMQLRNQKIAQERAKMPTSRIEAEAMWIRERAMISEAQRRGVNIPGMPPRAYAPPFRPASEVTKRGEGEPRHACAVCSRDASFLCSGCQSAWYCSPECQLAAWGEHSKRCGENRS